MIARGKWVLSYLLACLKRGRHVTCDVLETTLATTTANGDTRKETKKVRRKSSGATVGVASFGQTQLNTLDKRFVTVGIAVTRTVDSFQRRLDSNVQSIMSRMVRELIWNKPSNHWRPKPGICTISINCPFMTRCQKKNYIAYR